MPAPTRIAPSRGWASLNLGELWRFRELVYFLIWRDVKVRYKQTLLGVGWAILQPFLTMVVFSLFFGELAGLSSGGIPYPIFSFTALLPWQFFENGVTKAGQSLVMGRNLVTKVYFPRLAMPLAAVVAGLVDFALAGLVLVGLMAYYGARPTSAIWTLPLFLALALITALGVSFLLSALNVAYRDVGYLIPFLMRLWFFSTPIVYAASEVPEAYRTLYALNPMVGVVEGFRWAALGLGDPPSAMVAVSTLAAAALLVVGALYFRRMERTFADVV
ncbi:MAG: phosphate ABC transporter permease [Gammaproteobacteria bacterium RBG_16_66_13]|nr:MAG: phosphate ABC transporter permease [Gammaproteobacteria bacterium RBG_16_66_13]